MGFGRPRKSPLVAILAHGLAIGSGSAIFSVVNAVILKPLSFDASENVAIIWERAASELRHLHSLARQFRGLARAGEIL